jgi:hypothetical protein
LESRSEEQIDLISHVRDINDKTVPDSCVAMGAPAPAFLASFRLLSLATYALRTEEKFYGNVSRSTTIGQYIKCHIVFDTTQNGVVVTEFDLALANFLYNLHVTSIGHVASLGRRCGRTGISTGAGGCRG